MAECIPVSDINLYLNVFPSGSERVKTIISITFVYHQHHTFNCHTSSIAGSPGQFNGKKTEKPALTTAPKSYANPDPCSQMLALFYKRFLHHARDLRNYISQIIMPILFICLAMGMSIIVPANTDEPSILLGPQLYKDTDAFYRY